MARLEIEIGAVNNELKKILQDSKIALNNFAKEVNGSKGALSGLSQSSADTRRAIDEQRVAQERAKTATMQARQASAELTLANRQNKGSIDAAAGSYREAQNRLTALGRSIREAKGGFDSTNPAIRAQITEYNKLNTKLKEFDKAMGNNYRNVGNYSSALTNVIPQLSQFTTGAGLAATATSALGKSFFTNLKLDSLYEGLRVASGSAESFDKNVSFLRESSERLGMSFADNIKSFKLFFASATGANISAEDTRRIFDSVANAGAKLRLSTDDVNGALLALSQMASKGKVQAEELRGQLGERLPRAFELAAKAMGVTTAQLNKMLEDGEVVSDVFLPKFATELDKAFGNDATEKITGMQASMGRLKTAMDSLWESEKVKNWFTEAIDGVAELTNEINKLINSNDGNFWGRFWDKDFDLKRQTVLQSSGFGSLGTQQQLDRINKQRMAVETLAKAYGNNDIRFTSQFHVLNQMTKEYASQFSKVTDINKELDRTSEKGAKVSKSLKSIDEILPSLQGNDGNYYDKQLAKINSDYSKLVKTINESSGSSTKISEALGLAEAKKDFDTLKVSVDRFIDSTKGIKTKSDGISLTGSISDPTRFSPSEWERLRLGGRNYTTKKEDKDQEEKFSKIIERSLRGGINDILDDIDNLGSHTYEVFANVFSKLTKPFQNIFSSVLSTYLSGIISAKMGDVDLFKMGNDKSKNLIAGIGSLGSLISGVSKKKNVLGQVGGGALSGAAAGTAILPGWGTAIGAIVGALGGFFSAKSAQRQEKNQEQQLEEQRKQTALQQRIAALTFTSSITGQMTNQGIVTSVDRNEFGDITFRVEGRDLVASMSREQEAKKRGL